MKKGLERLKQLQNIEESPNLVITDDLAFRWKELF